MAADSAFTILLGESRRLRSRMTLKARMSRRVFKGPNCAGPRETTERVTTRKSNRFQPSYQKFANQFDIMLIVCEQSENEEIL